MKIKLLTFCDLNYKSIGDISIPIMRKYCELHHIEFNVHNKPVNYKYDVYWNKIILVRNALEESDWVIWLDADIIIKDLLFNCNDYLINKSHKDLFISSDINGICLGCFFVKSSQWSLDLLDTMIFLGDIQNCKIGIYDVKNNREQDTLKVLVDYFDNVSSKIEIIPETLISNPRSQIGEDNVFAHHYWANRNPKEVAEEMSAYTPIEKYLS